MKQETIFILAVAIITWGGVFFYLLRLNFLARDIEKKISERDEIILEEKADAEKLTSIQSVHSQSAP